VKGENAKKNTQPEPTVMKGLFIGRHVHGSINVKWEQDELCDTGCPIEPPSVAGTPKPDTGWDSLDDFAVKSWPNPSDTAFNLKVRTLDRVNTIQVSVYDMSNKLVYRKSIKPDQEYSFGKELEGGMYMVKISQAGKVKILRLVKY
ncbi:MAG TPA: T9SS type A sorting domain-containing protein, partial [Flavobacteriaceae bacterium]|nr:T9SS type A sorting domain-containing protein [Flavobacteriaceae bacterium]